MRIPRKSPSNQRLRSHTECESELVKMNLRVILDGLGKKHSVFPAPSAPEILTRSKSGMIWPCHVSHTIRPRPGFNSLSGRFIFFALKVPSLCRVDSTLMKDDIIHRVSSDRLLRMISRNNFRLQSPETVFQRTKAVFRTRHGSSIFFIEIL